MNPDFINTGRYNKGVTRREFTFGVLLSSAGARAEGVPRTVRGVLTPDGLRTAEGVVKLSGDEPTMGVLRGCRRG